MSNYPDPCIACERTSCPKNCAAWRTRYLYRQAQINAYAKHNGIVPGAPEYKPGKNPCVDCARNEECSSICKARAAWWDECIKRAKDKMEGRK